MLIKLKIGPRLTAGFGIVIGVFLVAMSVVLYFQKETLQAAQQIQRESLPFALTADEMVLDVTQVQQFLQDAAATHNRESFDEADRYARDFKINLSKFQEMFQNENDAVALKKLAELDKNFDAFYDLGKKMTEVYISKGIEAGNELMGDFDKQTEALSEDLGALRQDQVDEANEMANTIVAASTLSRNALMLGAAIGLLLGAFISYWVTRTIVNPVTQLQTAIEDIEAKGDFSRRVRINGNDEVGLMAKAFNALLEAQQKAISEVSNVVGKMAEGEFSSRVHADLKGDLLLMKNAVNESADGIQNTMQGLNKLMLALYNGQFDVQSNTQGKGEFKQALDQAAMAMGALQSMLGEISHVMQGVSQSNLTMRVEGNGRGELAVLKENLNTSLYALGGTMKAIHINTRQVATAANEFTAAIGQIADGAQNQKHAMSQVLAALTQTTSAVMDVARNTAEASTNSRASIGLVKSGQGKMDIMIEVVNNIAANSAKINKITEVIEGIANKTNLLSLNAAIEAARAGEHGKGFSVVAEEVGKLASSSAESTQQITLLVQEAAAEAARAVETVKQVAEDMRNIEASANATDGMLERISAAMEQQSAAVEEINANVGSLERIADNNASASEEISATVMELSRVADSTRAEVEKFRI
ncbi:MAG: Methyl-accepting chemotaxis protein PctC [Pseudomonadota bacterium]